MPLTVTTWNINSVRLRINLVSRFIKAVRPDVICLQETKSPDDAFPMKRFRRLGYMTAMLDIDQLRTFIAISETGSFTKAAEVVNKTQSAVSMQMKRLEERLERPIFSRDGRASKLTEDGQRLLDYARRIVKLNVETLAAFSDGELSGRVRLGVPDDYADRYLPEIMRSTGEKK